MSSFKFETDPNSTQLKYMQLVDALTQAISAGMLKEGGLMPSINYLIKECKLSRDTVFKAYYELKTRGVIVSVPNRGYFVAQSNKKVLLFLDTFKAYKEVLYASFVENLPDNIGIDLQFHHYNIDLFEKVIDESAGKYSAYVIMSFDHQRMETIMKKIPTDRLLIIDWQIHCPIEASSVFQSFEKGLYDGLSSQLGAYANYKQFIYLYPSFTHHPKQSTDAFMSFCTDHDIQAKVITDVDELDVQKGDLYLLVSDRTLSLVLDQCSNQSLELGTDVGIISYNETPMKKYIKSGISVITTDFYEMGKEAALFTETLNSIDKCIPTRLIRRASF